MFRSITILRRQHFLPITNRTKQDFAFVEFSTQPDYDCTIIQIGNMDLEKGRYQKIGGFRYMNMEIVSWLELRKTEETCLLQMIEKQGRL